MPQICRRLGPILTPVAAAAPNQVRFSPDMGHSSVDPVKAYPLAVHLNGIAVDHRGDAGHVCKGRGGEQA